LTSGGVCGEDSFIDMKKLRLMRAAWLGGVLSLLPPVAVVTSAVPFPKAPAQHSTSSARLTIEVTGGEKETPVENASVYLKYVEERKFAKDKKYELNVKTNRDGVAHVPDAPLGRVLIQIVAEGWKTYGRWFDITDAKEPIKIHLDRPPKWY
jgi:hypothetical protein